MPYQPPADIWEVNASLQLDEALEGEDDPRWVDTQSARGENRLRQLRLALGMSERQLKGPRERGYYLFCGHRGSGKSTELRRIRNDLDAPDAYCVVFADAAQELDVNNLRYQDVLLHLAGKLMERLEKDGVIIEQVHLQRLQAWFLERVESRVKTEDFTQEIRAGVEAGAGIPGLAKLFARVSNALKTNSTYKVELRQTLQNHFTDFSEAFNHLIGSSEEAIRDAGKGRRILFVIDGTDRLSGKDATAFFVSDVHQLQQVHGRFIYCAPVHLAYAGNEIRQNFDRIFQLPMIKIVDQDGTTNQDGRDVMREMLHKRAAPDLFDEGVADILVEYSGGHPRDLLRLLHNTFLYAEHGRFDEASARRAVREVATDFRRFLGSKDYRLLAEIDSAPPEQTMPDDPDHSRKLLYHLALLEYNNFFWRSHPAIRTTDEYEAARNTLKGDIDG